MTLLELLVQELPKRGGWTVGSLATQDGVLSADGCCVSFWDEAPKAYGDGEQSFWADSGSTRANKGYGVRILGDFEVAEDFLSSVISREQYESALAASKQQVWSGEGLPPVGAVIEYSCIFFNPNRPAIEKGQWYKGTVIAYYDDCVWTSDNGIRPLDNTQFRPIRTEAERKRDQAITQMMELSAVLVEATAGLLYDAIAAGKIPGIKLSD